MIGLNIKWLLHPIRNKNKRKRRASKKKIRRRRLMWWSRNAQDMPASYAYNTIIEIDNNFTIFCYNDCCCSRVHSHLFSRHTQKITRLSSSRQRGNRELETVSNIVCLPASEAVLMSLITSKFYSGINDSTKQNAKHSELSMFWAFVVLHKGKWL